MMVRVELLAVTPLVIATAVIDFASASGAAWTEWAESVPAMMSVVEFTPHLEKKRRSFSKAWLTRLLAAFSLTPNVAPTCFRFLMSHCKFLCAGRLDWIGLGPVGWQTNETGAVSTNAVNKSAAFFENGLAHIHGDLS
jgi:hypothetical protein